MTRTLISSVTFAASVLALAWGCGGSGPNETPHPPTTVAAPAAAPAAPAAAAAPAPSGEAADDQAPLLAWAEGDPEDGKAPLTVEFKADVEGGKAPLKYTWKFGDGSPDSTDANPKHTYDKPGKYRADLSVADSGGDSDSDYVEVTVN